MIKFDLDESKTECKQAVIWCLGTYDVICKKYIKTIIKKGNIVK